MTETIKNALSPANLDQFTGTEGYTWGTFHAILLTDGTTYMSANGAGWLLDAIGSHIMANPKFKAAMKADPYLDLHFWYLERDPKNPNGAILTMRKDSGLPPIISQTIEYTDFPLDLYPKGFHLYAGLQEINGTTKFVLMLASEY